MTIRNNVARIVETLISLESSVRRAELTARPKANIEEWKLDLLILDTESPEII